MRCLYFILFPQKFFTILSTASLGIRSPCLHPQSVQPMWASSLDPEHHRSDDPGQSHSVTRLGTWAKPGSHGICRGDEDSYWFSWIEIGGHPSCNHKRRIYQWSVEMSWGRRWLRNGCDHVSAFISRRKWKQILDLWTHQLHESIKFILFQPVSIRLSVICN